MEEGCQDVPQGSFEVGAVEVDVFFYAEGVSAGHVVAERSDGGFFE